MTNEHPERDSEHIRYALRCAARSAALTAGDKEALFADADKLDALCWTCINWRMSQERSPIP